MTKAMTAFAAATIALVAFVTPLTAQVTTDMWDINQGGTITASSGAGTGDLRNMFGGRFPSPEPGRAFFRDDRPAGFVHFVEFQSAIPITLTGYHLIAADDYAINPGDRGFTEFRLFAFDVKTSSWTLLDTFTPASNPYPEHLVYVTRTFSPVTAQRFRAEFVQFAPNSFPGPRVIELDAITIPSFFYLYPDSGQVKAGVPLDVYVLALDVSGNVIPTYNGEIAFWSTDDAATLPEPYTFQPDDGGIAFFPKGVTFRTPGIQELYVFDTATFTVFGYAVFEVTGK